MLSDKQRLFAIRLAIVLLIVGCLTYAAFPAKPPHPPLRMMFHSAAGKVLFDHKTHTAESGYDFACTDCHHHFVEDEADIQSCNACHLPKNADKSALACGDCHEAEEVEDTVVQSRPDAFHTQCISCHDDGDAGPVECASCHVL
jgi:hypothetical protein